MKTKTIFLIMFCFVLIGACKKNESVTVQSPPVVKEVVKMTQEQFLLNLCKRTDVWNLKVGESINVLIPSEVLSPTAEVVVVEKFKSSWAYSELLNLLKKVPLTVVWVGDEGPRLLISNYFDFLDNYKSDEEFLVIHPKPMYHLLVGNKEYWVGSGGKFWKTW